MAGEDLGVALVHKQNTNQPRDATAKQLFVSNTVLTRVLFARYERQLLQSAQGWQSFSQVWVSGTDAKLCLHPLKIFGGIVQQGERKKKVNDKRLGKQVL